MHPVINGQTDENRHEGDCQNIQVSDGERGEGKRVAQADDQAQGRFHGPAGLLVAVDEDESANQQRNDAGDDGVPLGLGHFVVFEHGLAGESDVQPRDFDFCFFDQLAQSFDRCPVLLLRGRLGGDKKNATVGESDIKLLLGLFAGIE